MLKTATGSIFGTLTIPATVGPMPLVVIIPGSGPTDRDGNNRQMQNNSLLMIADSLAKWGIATLRYDKRGIGESKASAIESKLRFEDYVGDVADWLKMLRADKRFSRFYIFGHSEGSLIGMLAAKKTHVDGFISAEGPALPADEVLLAQLRSSPNISQGKTDTMTALLSQLRAKGRIDNVPAGFYQAFLRPSVQGYYASWMKYNPSVEIKGITAPILIIQGTADLQVDTAQARMLATARPGAKLIIIPQMNHIFKEVDPEHPESNMATYYEAGTPIMSAPVRAVAAFIKDIKKKK